MWKLKPFDAPLLPPYNNVNQQQSNSYNNIIINDVCGNQWINVEAIKNNKLLMKILNNK